MMGKLKNIAPRIGGLGARVKPPAKIADPFYLSREWRALVARIKRERGAWCERCGSGDRVIGDHIVERRAGGADLDPGNVTLLCLPPPPPQKAQGTARGAQREK